MASVYSNLLSPKQAAMNNKINPNPLPFTAPVQKVNPQGVGNAIGGALSGGLNAIGSLLNKPMPASLATARPSYMPAPTTMPGLQPLPSITQSGQTPANLQKPEQLPIIQKAGEAPMVAKPQSLAVVGNYNTNTATDPIINAAAQAPQGIPAPAAPQTPAPIQNQVTYPGLVSTLASRAQQDSPEVQRAREQLKQSQVNEANAETTNRLNPIPIGDQTGREAVIRSQYLGQQNALSSQLSSAVTTQGQQLGALNNAAGLAAPQLASYSQQQYNPLTGQFSGGGSLNDAVGPIAQRVQAGQMSYDDAVSALSGYGQGGVNALQQALGPNFNVAQSNTLATQQGSIGPALEYARASLNNLKSTLSQLQIPGQNSNIPLIGGVASGISGLTGIGGQQTSAKNNAIAEARNAIQKVLASVQGGTPTDYTGQSHTLLPDNATPQQIDAAIQTLESLGTAKQQIYGNPGQTSSTNQNGTQPSGWL